MNELPTSHMEVYYETYLLYRPQKGKTLKNHLHFISERIARRLKAYSYIYRVLQYMYFVYFF